MASSRGWYLSIEADRDLQEIFDYGQKEFGVDVAFEYVSSFDALFELLSANPEIGKERNDIREGLRSMVKESHVVFYRLTPEYVRIVRVLHGSRDISSQMAKD